MNSSDFQGSPGRAGPECGRVSCRPAGARARRAPLRRRATSPSRQANVGFATGVAVGAVTAGPVGAMLGAPPARARRPLPPAPAKLRRHWPRTLRTAKHSAPSSAPALPSSSGSLAQARCTARSSTRPLQQTDQLGLDVSFRTDDDGVTVQALSPLLKLGALVVSVPQAPLRIAGFADAARFGCLQRAAVAAARAQRRRGAERRGRARGAHPHRGARQGGSCALRTATSTLTRSSGGSRCGWNCRRPRRWPAVTRPRPCARRKARRGKAGPRRAFALEFPGMNTCATHS